MKIREKELESHIKSLRQKKTPLKPTNMKRCQITKMAPLYP